MCDKETTEINGKSFVKMRFHAIRLWWHPWQIACCCVWHFVVDSVERNRLLFFAFKLQLAQQTCSITSVKKVHSKLAKLFNYVCKQIKRTFLSTVCLSSTWCRYSKKAYIKIKTKNCLLISSSLHLVEYFLWKCCARIRWAVYTLIECF